MSKYAPHTWDKYGSPVLDDVEIDDREEYEARLEELRDWIGDKEREIEDLEDEVRVAEAEVYEIEQQLRKASPPLSSGQTKYPDEY